MTTTTMTMTMMIIVIIICFKSNYPRTKVQFDRPYKYNSITDLLVATIL